MKQFLRSVSAIMFTLISVSVFSTPLSGVYTIGSSGNYTTFTAAAAALNTLGISGPVTFNVAAGTYTESFQVNAVTGSSATNTITFQAANGVASSVTVTFNDAGYPDYTVIGTAILSGSQYVTLNNLTITTQYSNAVLITHGAAYISITNCLLNCPVNSFQYSYVIFSPTVTTQNGTNNNIVVSGCTITGGGYGYVAGGAGYSGTLPITTNNNGPTVINNTFTKQVNEVIYLYSCINPLIQGNSISSGKYGINLQGYCNNVIIKENSISSGIYLDGDPGGVGSGGYCTSVTVEGNTISSGISLSGEYNNNNNVLIQQDTVSGSIELGSNNNNVTIQNSEITVTGNPSTVNCINDGGCTNVKILANKIYGSGTAIYISNTNTEGPGLIADNFISTNYGIGNWEAPYMYNYSILFNSFYTATTGVEFSHDDYDVPSIILENNIFYIPPGGGGNQVNDLYVDPNAFIRSDYNDFGGIYPVARDNGGQQSLAQWQAYSGFDAHSQSITPPYVSSTDLHLTSYTGFNFGTPLAQVTHDIDGVLRNPTHPDVGASEKPVPTLAGDSTPCNSSVTAYPYTYTTDAGFSPYVWTLTGSYTILAGGTSTDNTIQVKWTTPGSISISYNGATVATLVNVVPYTCGVISATAVGTNSSTSCSSDGKLTLTVNSGGDGTNNYKYVITGPTDSTVTGPSGRVVTRLKPGSYSIVVSDAANPADGFSETIPGTVSPALTCGTISPSVTGTGNATNSCNTQDGSISLTASGGNWLNAYYYVITGGRNNVTRNVYGYPSVTVSNLAAGNYSITAYDANSTNGADGWSATTTTTVNPTYTCGPITASVTGSVNASTSCSDDGSITITASGGDYLNDYYFVLTGVGANNGTFTTSGNGTGVPGTTFSGLPAASYTIDVYDASSPNGADGYDTYASMTSPTIDLPATNSDCGSAIDANAYSYSDATNTCSTDGSIEVDILDGGDGLNNYYFVVTGPVNATPVYGPSGTIIGGLSYGTYNVAVYDASSIDGYDGLAALTNPVVIIADNLPVCQDPNACNSGDCVNACTYTCMDPNNCNYQAACGTACTYACTDPNNCNYNLDCYTACTYACTDPNNCNYNLDCTTACYYACTDPNSCNYNQDCTTACTYACNDPNNCNYHLDCTTACTYACTDPNNCNYNLDCTTACYYACTDPNSCNYNQDCTTACTYACNDPNNCNYHLDCTTACTYACTDPNNCNYNLDCTTACYYACTDPSNCNYNLDCTTACYYACTDPSNCNYNLDCTTACYYACTDPNSCNYNQDCATACTYACNDPNNCNYHLDCTTACTYACTDPNNCNYNLDCTTACTYACTDPNSCNYNQDCTTACTYACNNPNNCNYHLDCTTACTYACNDPNNCNYHLDCTTACTYACTDPNNCNYNLDCTTACYYACTDPNSCNYNQDCTTACTYTCNDPNNCNYHIDCSTACTYACTDPNNCNYNLDCTTACSYACIDPNACNYHQDCITACTYACNDPNNCNYHLDCSTACYYACTDPNASNYNADCTSACTYAQISFSLNPSDENCPGSGDGSCTVNVSSGGDGANNYTISWSGAGSGSITAASGYNITGLIGGTLSVSIADAANNNDGSANGTSTTIGDFSSNCNAIMASITGSTPENCPTSNDGSIALNISGGDGTNSYYAEVYNSSDQLWFGTSGGNTITIGGLPAGNYTLLNVWDEHSGNYDGDQLYNQVISTILTDNNPSCPSIPIQISTSTTNSSCPSSDNGSLTVSASGGSGGYYYFAISGPQSANAEGTSPHTFTGLAPDNYSITVYDASVIDQTIPQSSANNGEGAWGDPTLDETEWEPFTPGTTGLLTELDLVFARRGGTYNGTATLNIYAGNGTGGTLLTSQTVNVLNDYTNELPPYNNAVNYYPLNTPVAVTGGNVYTFQLVPISGLDQMDLATNYYGSGGSTELCWINGCYTFGGDWAYTDYVSTPSPQSDGYQNTSSAVVGENNPSCGPNTWQGNNTNWNDPTNWSSGNPPSGLCTEVVSIPTPTGEQEPILTGPESVGNLSLGSGASIDIDRFNLSVCGNITGGSGATDGDILAPGGGELVLNGTSLQQISGKVQVQSIHLANSAGVQLQAGTQLDIYTTLELESGQFDASNGVAKLKSTTVSQAAIIDNFSNLNYVGTYLGNVTAERYYAAPTTANSYNQHEMGSPVSAPALSQFGASGTPGYVSDANCDGTKLDNGSPYGTVFGYDETHGAHCGVEQWKVLTSGNAVNGAGYSIRSGGPGTLSLTGSPNITGNVTINGTNSGWTNSTLQGYPEQSGWTLASNPYPATLQISPGSLASNVTAGWDGVGVMVWNTTGGSAGSYKLTTTLAPFQAFMVHISGAGTQSSPTSATYTIYATDRVTSAGGFFKEAANNQLNITATNQSSGLTDVTTVGFNQNATSGFDPNFDVHKIAGDPDRHSLYSLSNGNWMYQNINQSIEQTPTVPMGFSPGVNGTYTLHFDGIASFDPTSYITLEDTKTGTMYDVRNGDYSFTSGTSDGWNRFVLHFTPPASISAMGSTCAEEGMINIVQPGTAVWNYTLADNNNVVLSSGTLNVNAPVNASVPVGTYTLTLKDNNGYSVVKTVEVSGVQPVVASFTTSANSVHVNQPVSLSSTSTGAVTNSWNFGDGATDNGTTVTHAYVNEGVYNATLSSTSASGCNSSATNTITVTQSVTGVTNVNDINLILIWSNENIVNVDFTQLSEVQANIEIYNILGQKLSEDKYVTSTVYHKEIPNIEEGYIVVSVKNNDEIITKKLFISNVR